MESMESIYDPKLFKASDRMEINDYFKSFREVCRFEEPLARSDCLNLETDEEYFDRIRLEMGVNLPYEDLRELEERCSISKLTLSEEPNDMPVEVPTNLRTGSKLERSYPTNESARQLNVVISMGYLKRKYNITTDFLYSNKRFIKTTTLPSNSSVLCDMMPGSNFIYSIIVYKPHSINFLHKNSKNKMRFAFEIEALGTQTLADVADKIYCIANEALFQEVEDTKADLKPLMNAKAYYPSQSFFIDGVFYNDFRSPDAIDYSFKIIQWANLRNLGRFQTELMEKTVLNTLTPRLGYPYVYMHQGSCEHIFTFSDARLLQPGDCLNSTKYPRISSINRVNSILCFMCGVMNGQWIVIGCDKFPHEKVFLCTKCCDSYLYVDGKKVTSFKLYPYYDQEMLTKHLDAVVVD